jgi:hypothetical protein
MPPTTATAGAQAAPSTGLTFSDLLGTSWDLVKAHPIALALPLVLLGLVSGGGNAEPTWRADMTDIRTITENPFVFLPFFALFGLLALAIGVALFILTSWAWVATSRQALDALRGTSPTDPLAGFRATSTGALWSAWTMLVWVGAVILGFILLVVPGFLVLGALLPIGSVVAAEGLRGGAAVKRSWQITRGHRGALVGLILVGMLVSIAIGIIFSWLPIIGDAVAGAVGGVVYAMLAVAGAVFYVRASDHHHVSPMAAPAVLEP